MNLAKLDNFVERFLVWNSKSAPLNAIKSHSELICPCGIISGRQQTKGFGASRKVSFVNDFAALPKGDRKKRSGCLDSWINLSYFHLRDWSWGMCGERMKPRGVGGGWFRPVSRTSCLSFQIPFPPLKRGRPSK